MSYENKDIKSIKDDVAKEFEQKDIYGTRDDKEIYQAGIEVAKRYQKTMTDLYGNIDDGKIKDKRQMLSTQLHNYQKSLSGYDFFTHNKALIQDIAHKIDNVENELVDIIDDIMQKKNTQKEIETSVEKESNSYFKRNDAGNMQLTAATNKPRIDQVLGDLVQPGTMRHIDYSKCTNERIKNKMQAAMGGLTGYITHGTDSKGHITYVLQNAQYKKLSQRALIWEGVALTPDAMVQVEGRKKLDKKKEKESLAKKFTIAENVKLKDIKEDLHWQEVIAALGTSKLKNKLESANGSVYKEFLEKSEQRLDEIIIYAKEHGWELHSTPISKLTWAYGGIMEAHLISGTAEKDMKFLDYTDHKITPELWNILDSNEGDYKTFLTQRIKKKWQEYGFMTKKENIFSREQDEDTEVIGSDEQKNIVYGLEGFAKILTSLQQAEGDSRDDDDHEFVAMQQHVQNSIYSIQQSSHLTSDQLKQKIFDPLQHQREKFRYWNVGDFNGAKDWSEEFATLLSGKDKKAIQKVMRQLGESTTLIGNTHTSFLAQDLDDELKLNNETFDIFYNNIAEKLDVEKPQNSIILKEIYEAEDADTDKEDSIKTILQKYRILPNDGSIAAKKINAVCKKIKDNITEMKESFEKNMPTKESIWENMQQQKAQLMAKHHKTDEDISQLHVFEVYEQNPTLKDKVLSGRLQKLTSEVVGYTKLQNVVRGAITPLLAKAAGGTDSNIYDDIVGAGGIFERSDENAQQFGEGVKGFVTEVAIMLVAVGAGMMTGGAATAMIYGARTAAMTRKGISAVKVLMKHKKRKQLKNIGELKKLKDLRNIQRATVGSSRVHQAAARAKYAFTPTPGKLIGGVIGGATYAILDSGVRGELWEVDTNEFLYKVFSGAIMVGVLKAAEAVFASSGFINGLKRIGIEEPVLMGSDYFINSFQGKSGLTMDDIVQNISIAVAFEVILGLKARRSGRTLSLFNKKGELVAQGDINKPQEIAAKALERKEVRDHVRHMSENLGTTKEEMIQKIAEINTKLEAFDSGEVNEVMNILRKLENPNIKEKTRAKLEKSLQSRDNQIVALCYQKMAIEKQIANFETKSSVKRNHNNQSSGKPKKATNEKPKNTSTTNPKQKTTPKQKIDKSTAPRETTSEKLSAEQQKHIQILKTEIKQLEAQRRAIRDMRKKPGSLSKLANQAGLKKGTKLSRAGDASGKYQILSINDKGIAVVPVQKGSQTPITIANKKAFEPGGRRIVDQKKSAAFANALASQKNLPSLDRINKQKDTLQKKIKQTQAEIKKIETENASPSMNSYFIDHGKQLHGTNMYRGGDKYRVTVQKDGTIQLKLADGKEHSTYASFAQMRADGVGVLAPQNQGRTGLSRAEKQLHTQYKNLIDGESAYMADRATSLDAKSKELTNLYAQQKQLEVEYAQAKKLDDQNKQIAKDAETVTKEIQAKQQQISSIYGNKTPKSQESQTKSREENQKHPEKQSIKTEDQIETGEKNKVKLEKSIAEAKYEDIKLDRVTRNQLYAGLFLDSLQKRMKNATSANIEGAKNFLKRVNRKLNEIYYAFPNLRDKILPYRDVLNKKIRKKRIEESLKKIKSYENKRFEEKLALREKNKAKDLSTKELKAFFELFAGPTNIDDRAVVGSGLKKGERQNDPHVIQRREKERNDQLKGRIDSEIKTQKEIREAQKKVSRKKEVASSKKINQNNEVLIETGALIPDTDIHIGDHVRIPRTSGKPSIANVVLYNSKRGRMLCERTEDGKRMRKRLPLKSVTNLKKTKIEEGKEYVKARIIPQLVAYEKRLLDLQGGSTLEAWLDARDNLAEIRKQLTEMSVIMKKDDITQGLLYQAFAKIERLEDLISAKKETSGKIRKYYLKKSEQRLLDQTISNKNKLDHYDQMLSADLSSVGKERLEAKLAYHTIGIIQMRRISTSALDGYSRNATKSKEVANTILSTMEKKGLNIDPSLEKSLQALADGKMLEYKDLKTIGKQFLGLDSDASHAVGQRFLDFFASDSVQITEQ